MDDGGDPQKKLIAFVTACCKSCGWLELVRSVGINGVSVGVEEGDGEEVVKVLFSMNVIVLLLMITVLLPDTAGLLFSTFVFSTE